MAHTSFASRLDEALIAAPYSLDRIVDILAKQGLKVSQATLSHWRSGRSTPKRYNSLRIVAALEDILTLPSQALSSLLPSDIKKNTDASPPESGTEPSPVDSSFSFLYDEADRATDWSNEVQREFMEGETVVSADFLTQTYSFVILARVPQVQHPCLHVSVGLNNTDVIPETGYVDFYNIKGATIGERQVYADGLTTVTRLDLPSSCYPGQLHRISFTYSCQSTVPYTTSLLQLLVWPLHFYVSRVEFEGKVPENIEWIEETVQEEDNATYTSISTRPVIPIGNTIQICIEKPEATRGYFRWK